jgi:di/tricarboxylate transporter
MSLAALFTLILTLAAAVLLISERLRPDLIALFILIVLGLAGITTPQETFAGFSNSAVMTILGISIISEGLRQTGVTRQLGLLMYKIGQGSEMRLILIVSLISAALSLFMNNIAAVGVLLPAVLVLARRSKIPASRLLLPLAYGTLLGGMATLLTTPNIIVSGALRDSGLKPFGLLDFLPIGGPVALVGLIYVATLGRWLLPKQNEALSSKAHTDLINLYQLQNDLAEVIIMPGSPLVGSTLSNSHLAEKAGINVVARLQKGQLDPTFSQHSLLNANEHLIIHAHSGQDLASVGLEPSSVSKLPKLFSEGLFSLSELILEPHSDLIGQSIRQSRFREKYGVNVLAIWRQSSPLAQNFADLPLRFGDALLVEGAAAHTQTFQHQPGLIILNEDPDAVQRPGKHQLALLITLLTLGFAAFDILPVSIVAVTGAVFMLLADCLNMNDVYKSMEWKAIFLIAGMWPLSTAIRTTGLASNITGLLTLLPGPIPPLLTAAILIGFALLMTQIMGGQVASLVLAPLALSAAHISGIDARSLAMAVALGCSLAFPTPYGHPVNLMVMSPGGYHFKDYLRVGLPLTILAFLTILFGLHQFWGV